MVVRQCLVCSPTIVVIEMQKAALYHNSKAVLGTNTVTIRVRKIGILLP